MIAFAINIEMIEVVVKYIQWLSVIKTPCFMGILHRSCQIFPFKITKHLIFETKVFNFKGIYEFKRSK